jgi:hypothetical protein
MTRDSRSADSSFLPPASVLGIGAVTPIGRELSTITTNLFPPLAGSSGARTLRLGSRGVLAPENPAEGKEFLRVNDDLLADPSVSRGLRRADHFVRMAAIAALDAWTSARGAGAAVAMEKVGLIITSGLGPHGRSFKFLDGILDCGDSSALPTDFSHSVHGVAASYVAGLLDLRGPSLSTTDFECGFEQAVLLAQCWLNSGACTRVLLGAVEELGEVLIHCASRLLADNPPFVLGEGAVFLTLGPSDAPGIAHLDAAASAHDVGLLIVDEPSLFPPSMPPTAAATATFTPYFGHSASNSAFQALGGLLSLSAGRPLGRVIHPPQPASPSPFDNAMTFRTLCDRPASLLLKRTK